MILPKVDGSGGGDDDGDLGGDDDAYDDTIWLSGWVVEKGSIYVQAVCYDNPLLKASTGSLFMIVQLL